MASLPDLVGRIRLDMSELDRARGEANTRGAAIGSALGSAVGSLAGGALAAAGAKVTEFVSGSVDAFAKLQDSTQAAGVVFGSSFGKVDQFASQAAKAIGVSKAEALDAAITFGTFGKAAGLAGNDLSGFSNNMVQLAGDMASFRGTSPEEAITAIGAAFRGEYDPIEKYGVLINANTVKQEAERMGLVKHGQELDTHAKILATQSLIYKQTADAQGDFSRSGDSVANTQKRIAAETENAQAALGEKLAPAYLAVLNALNQLIGPIGVFVDALGKVFEWAGKAATTIWQWKDAIAGVLIVLGILNAQTIAFNVAAAAYLAVQAAIRVATAAWTAVQWLLNAALTANPIGLVVAAIAALVAIFVVAYNHSETFRAAVDGLGAAFMTFVNNAIPAITDWATKVGASFMQAVADVDNFGNQVNALPDKVGAALANFAVFLWDKVVNAWDAVTTAVQEKTAAFLAVIQTWYTNITTAVSQFATMLWQNIIVAGWNHVQEGWNAAITFLTQTIPTWISGIVASLANFAAQLWQNIGAAWEFVKTNWAAANQFIVSTIAGWIANIVSGLSNFAAQLWAPINTAWERVKQGWSAANQALVQATTQFVNNVINGLAAFAQRLWDAVVGAWNKLPEGIRQPIEQVVQAAAKLATDIVQSLANLPAQMVTMGHDIINGLLNGLQQLGPQIVSYLTNLIPEPVRKALNIASPSGVMKEIGNQTMQGLEQGLQEWMPKIQSVLSQILEIINGVKSQLKIASPSGLMIDMGGDIMSGLANGLEQWIPKIQGILNQVLTMVKDHTKDLGQVAEDGSKVASGFYDSIMVGGKTFTKGQAGWAAAAAKLGVSDAYIKSAGSTISGGGTIAGQNVSGSFNPQSGMLSGQGFGQSFNIDARSFGTQLNAKDVVDQILWKAKAGGLVPA